MERAVGFENSGEPAFYMVVYVGTAFILLALISMISIFISRVRKSNQLRKSASIRERVQGILNAVIVNDTFGNQTSSSFGYRIDELRSIAGRSAFNNNVIIQLMIQVRKNLSGSSSAIVKKVYDDLGLEKYSLKKLKGWTWKERALGIRELTEMQQNTSAAVIAPFLRSRNPALREESFMAMVRLDSDKPFAFLDDYRGEISPWMQLNIHSYLQKKDARTLPDFSRWFEHPVKTVRLFSIAMAMQFRQSASLEKLAGLVDDENAEISIAAIEALTTLEGYQFADRVITRMTSTTDEKILVACIRSLAKIGDPDQVTKSLNHLLEHPKYTIRFEAAVAMKSLGPSAFQALKTLNITQHLKLDQLIAHLEEPLLQ